MSSQNQGLPFYSVPDSSGFRLIEIPPELESLLEAPGAPVYETPSKHLASEWRG